jgi:CRISPR-associated endonuclease/helicase Cas3
MFEPYPYQKRVLAALMSGRNVILVVPTGSGKTFASTLPFFHNRLKNLPLLPNKALYVVPMRVLATQFQATCTQLIEEDLNTELLTELNERYKSFGRLLLSIQTGESPHDPLFESMITACTIDQLLASALGIPYSVSAKLANINVGLLCSSYLILDEPHLYPLSQDGRSYKGAFTTCLELLRLLKGLTRFVFMSATMSRPLVEQLARLLDADIITASEDELNELNKERVRTIERASQPLNATTVLAHHDRCTLAVCNTVQRAQELYLELDKQIAEQQLDIDLKLLHSRFTDADRKQQGEDLQSLLGKEQWKEGQYQGQKSVIVVATQVVEVGLDISAQIVHTELAPANSIVQRAGRCARFAKQHGRVIVYALGNDEQGQPVSSLPYNMALCQNTWEALARYDGQVVGFTQEQELIDAVHTESDLDLLKRYEKHRYELQDLINTSLQQHKRQGTTDDLIRDVTQVQILIHNTPKETITTTPWRWQSFGVHPGQLLGRHWENLKARQNELDTGCLLQPVLAPSEQPDDEEDNHAVNTYTWIPVSSEAEITGALMIALPDQLATYHSELGLVFLDGRLKLSEQWLQRLSEHPYQSEKLKTTGRGRREGTNRVQRYEEHIGGLADAYHYALYDELAYGMTQLEKLMGFAPASIDQAIQLAIATHDLGKLDQRWQQWAREWQRLRHHKKWTTTPYNEPASSVFLAKTDSYYGPANDERAKEQREWQKELAQQGIKRPHHACESVAVGRVFIAYSLGMTGGSDPRIPLLRATCAAIAHHHTTSAHKYGATHIQPEARRAIEKALNNVRRGSTWSYDLKHLKLEIPKDGDLFYENANTGQYTKPDITDAQQRLETWLSYLITRALRLADQRADGYAS